MALLCMRAYLQPFNNVCIECICNRVLAGSENRRVFAPRRAGGPSAYKGCAMTECFVLCASGLPGDGVQSGQERKRIQSEVGLYTVFS